MIEEESINIRPDFSLIYTYMYMYVLFMIG